MFASGTNSSILISRYCRLLLPCVPIISPSLFRRATVLHPMDKTDKDSSIKTSSFSSYAHSSRSGGGGRGSQMRIDRERTRGGRGRRGGGASGSGKDKIDALGHEFYVIWLLN